MKKLIDLFAIMAVISLTTFLVGCGGDDDDDDDAPPPQTQFAPASVANHVVTLIEGGQTRDVQFAAAGSNFTQFETGTTNAVGTGSFQYSRLNNNNGQLILTTTDAQGATVQVTYNLAFTSATGGTYTFASSTGQTGSGTFSNLRQVVDNGGGGNGGGNGDGNGDGNGGGNGGGEPPTAISGRAIDFTAAGAGNERLTFATSGNSVTSDAINPPNNVGTYTFTPGTGGAPSNLVVSFPNGDTYNLTMTFTDATHGSWSGNQFFDNSDHPVPAGSSFTIQP